MRRHAKVMRSERKALELVVVIRPGCRQSSTQGRHHADAMTSVEAAESRSGDSPDQIGRVLIVAPQPFYEDRGTPIAVAQLAAALSDLGAEIDLLTYPVGSNISIRSLRIIRSRNPLAYRSVPIGFSVRKLVLDLCMLPTLARLIRSDNYDVVHAVEELALPAAVFCRSRGIPVIYDMQSSLPDQLRTHFIFRLRPVQSLMRWIESWMVRRADAIVCSAGLLDHVKSVDSGALAREWLFVGQAPGDTAGEKALTRAELDLDADAPLVVYSGTFELYQGLDLLVAAMPRVLDAFPKAVFLLIGAPSDTLLVEKAIAMRLIRQGNLRILPRQRRAVVPSYLALADVLVSPRAYGDNVPLKIFDYMLSGTPIVATDTHGHRSVLSGETAVLVANTSEAIATGIISLLNDPVLAARLARQALNAAGRSQDRKSFAETVRTLYLEAKDHRRQRGR